MEDSTGKVTKCGLGHCEIEFKQDVDYFYFTLTPSNEWYYRINEINIS